MNQPDQLPAHLLTARLLAIPSRQRAMAKDYAEEYARGAIKAERAIADALQAELTSYQIRDKFKPAKMVECEDYCEHAKELHKRADALEAALKSVVSHWREFGPEHGFDETLEIAARALLEKPQCP